MLKRISIFVGLALFAIGINAEVIKVQTLNFKPGKIIARYENNGKERWRADVDLRTEKDGTVVIEKRGEGYFGNDNVYKTWHSEGKFNLANNQLIPVTIREVFYDKQGKVVNSLAKKYDVTTRKIICNLNGKVKVLAFPDDVVDDMNLSYMMANFIFMQKSSLDFHLVTLEPDLYSFAAKIMGTEELTVNGVKKNCYKIKLTVNLGILGAFAPTTYFWMEVNPPHAFVRYQGLESGLNTPHIIIDKIN